MLSRCHLAVVVTLLAIPILLRADIPASHLPDIQLQLADLLFDEGRYEEAIELYRGVRKEEAPDLQVRAGTGIVKSYLRVMRFVEARESARVLIEEAPRAAEYVSLLGDALWASGLFDEAEQHYRDALSLNERDPRGRRGLARALAARSQLDAAAMEALTALSVSPREGEYHYTLSYIYERLHRYEEAAAALGNYVNLLPNKESSEKAAWARAQVRFLRSFRNRVPLELEDTTTELHTVPFKLVRDKVVVKGRVNGARSLDFVLDTGSEMTIISKDTARRLGVTPVTYTLSAGVGEVGLRGLQVGRVDSLEFGSLRIKNVPVLIKNPELGNMPTREGEAFSPLSLGLSMAIDYGAQRLTIGRRTTPAGPNDVSLPLRVHRLALVRGLVNGANPASFVVDTGGEVISISRSTAESLGPRTVRHIPLKVYGTSGWDPDAFLLPGVNLAFDRVQMNNLAVVVLDLQVPSALLGFQLGGIVGHKFLSQYRVTFDLENSELRLSEL